MFPNTRRFPKTARLMVCRQTIVGSARHFRDSDVLCHLFEATVARCMAEGLVSCQRFAADASLIAADANKQTSCVPISCT